MAFYIVQRLGLAAVIVAAALAMLFAMIHLVPGDPASIALGPRATPELVADFRRRMGLDQPLPTQFFLFFANVLRGDLGRDIFTDRPVLEAVLQDLPYSLALAGAGLGWAVAIGIPLGCFSAIRPRHPGSTAPPACSRSSAIAIPSFVVAI